MHLSCSCTELIDMLEVLALPAEAPRTDCGCARRSYGVIVFIVEMLGASTVFLYGINLIFTPAIVSEVCSWPVLWDQVLWSRLHSALSPMACDMRQPDMWRRSRTGPLRGH